MQSVILEQIETMNELGGLIWFNEFKPINFYVYDVVSELYTKHWKFCSYICPREHHEGVSSQ